MHAEIVSSFCDPSINRWTFKATVFRAGRPEGFVAYGDADPTNVSTLVHGAEIRVAETRAVNRALRKAYGIGICSVEEMGSSPRRDKPPETRRRYRRNLPRETTAARRCGIAFAKLSASISSIPT
jgi:hypothetical protein